MEAMNYWLPFFKILNCLAGNVKMENFSSPTSAHWRNLREKERQVRAQLDS